MTEEIGNSMKRRAVIKGQLTRIYNFVKSLPLELQDVSECYARSEKV